MAGCTPFATRPPPDRFAYTHTHTRMRVYVRVRQQSDDDDDGDSPRAPIHASASALCVSGRLGCTIYRHCVIITPLPTYYYLKNASDGGGVRIHNLVIIMEATERVRNDNVFGSRVLSDPRFA